jgi:hypothetical protein
MQISSMVLEALSKSSREKGNLYTVTEKRKAIDVWEKIEQDKKASVASIMAFTI